ncbi:putative 2-aminoethylphosphonate ABC transporter substrate-binding protein [Paenibacillus sp. SYP-B3998]|uniref:Putative 2-aminoethylphosphonate ABC transporter substrate-binding protein n=1 Tax=Paenibacillus sp. SYP-B3998 TaxID=2678564 RepID=A0A6G3ZXL5_9BACL|nr:putative 2-aminoethylphosphonate ABC transporter substrate-binding protein [Paenibacillus sp. SYP-B3998]NEW06966.1 putative 2-aminoethylphosphonate ABC transporter substrate-binding protein [Paenibacillus sp. SYP-B3998]
MKKALKLSVVLTLSASLLAACGTAKTTTTGNDTASTPAPAQADVNNNELTIYTALEDDQIKTYLQTFKQSHPNLKVNIARDSTGVITAKLLAEKDNPQADVVWGTAATSLLVLNQNKMLEPYAPKGTERVVAEFKDTANPPTWVGIDAWETAFVVNTTEMEKRKLAVPTSYEDLTKPEYKGLITMPNPAASGTGFLTVSALIQLHGKDKSWEFMDKLHDNIGMYTQSGSKPSKLAGTGEYPIGISFGYRGITEKKGGAPVQVVFPKEGSGWDVEANALMKKKAIKPIAKEFLDWAISDEAMKEYNKNYAIVSVKSGDSKIPDGYEKDPVKQLIKNDLNKMAQERDGILTEWQKRYNTKSEAKK